MKYIEIKLMIPESTRALVITGITEKSNKTLEMSTKTISTGEIIPGKIFQMQTEDESE